MPKWMKCRRRRAAPPAPVKKATVFEEVKTAIAGTLVGYPHSYWGPSPVQPMRRTVGMMFSDGMEPILNQMAKNAIAAMQQHLLPVDDDD